jgi:superoxide dismutase, Cu-Zn family
MFRLNNGLGLGSLGLLLIAACHSQGTIKDPTDTADEGKLSAIATFQAKPGSQASGTATFAQEGENVRVVVEVNGASPGSHGIHVHEKGDCSAADFSSAGGHWNPTGQPHGCPPLVARHPGDLGNIEVNEDGKGRLETTIHGLTLGVGARSLLNKTVIVHESRDDCSSQPTGESGGRLLCAIIEPR